MLKADSLLLLEVILGDIWQTTPAVWVRLLAAWIVMTIDSFCPYGEEETAENEPRRREEEVVLILPAGACSWLVRV